MKWLSLALALSVLFVGATRAQFFSPPFVLPSVGASHTVVLDANSTSNTRGLNVTTLDNGNLTIGSGANRVLVAQIALTPNTTIVSTCVWDPVGANQSLTKINSAVEGAGTIGRVEIWALVAPVSGNKILRCTTSGTATDLFLNGVSFIGVNQTGGVTTFPNTSGATAVGGNPSVTVTSSSGNAVVDVSAAVENYSSPTQTPLFIDNNGSVVGTGGSWASGAASVTLSWTVTPNTQRWVSCAIDIKAN